MRGRVQNRTDLVFDAEAAHDVDNPTFINLVDWAGDSGTADYPENVYGNLLGSGGWWYESAGAKAVCIER